MMTAFFACQRDYEGPTDLGAPIETTATPGTRPENPPVPSGSLVPAVLNVAVTEFGQVSLSQDGLGTNAGTGTVEMVKPAGATVRSAHFFVSSRGFSGFTIPDGAMTLNGSAVNWAQVVAGPISNVNHRAVVTSHVATLLNAAPAGVVPVTIDEGANTFNIEESVLAVIWNDPTSTSTTNTVNLLFGAQSTTGDQFTLNLGQPFASGDVLDMSIASSFSFQPSGQVSIIDVNGQRLTSCAGGHDDGVAANGALATVGGTGDSNANPDPNCSGGSGPLVDDELYSLVPFVPVGSTTIQVNTSNPSNDDDIFYASFFTNIPAGVNEPPPGGGGDEGCPTTGPSSAGVSTLSFGLVTFHTGTFGDDVIIGTSGRDVILARAGDDVGCGLQLNDVFFGGDGDDQWFGGSGTDVGFGHAGSDQLTGGDGTDRNDGGHGGPPNAVDTDTDTCNGEFNFLCEVSGPDGAVVSSARFKTDIRPILPEGATILGLRPVTYRYRAPFGDPSVLRVGLIAEEVARVYPEVVTYSADGNPTAVLYGTLGARLADELGQRFLQVLRPSVGIGSAP
jgi:hypothetical protein